MTLSENKYRYSGRVGLFGNACYLVIALHFLLSTSAFAAKTGSNNAKTAYGSLQLKTIGQLRKVAEKPEIMSLGGERLAKLAFEMIKNLDAENSGDGEIRNRAIRLLILAAMVERVDLDNEEKIEFLSSKDVEVLNSTTGLLGNRDGLRYLIARNPSIADEFGFDRYVLVRIDLPALKTRSIRESVQPGPYLGLTNQFSNRFIPIDTDPVKMPERRSAEALKYNLAGIGHMILAAKSLRLAEELTGRGKIYALSVAERALRLQLYSNPDKKFAVAQLNVAVKLRTLLSATSDNLPVDLQEKYQRLNSDLRWMAFRARWFSYAHQEFVEAAATSANSRDLWGLLLSETALQKNSEATVDKIIRLIRSGDVKNTDLFLFKLLVDNGKLDEWRSETQRGDLQVEIDKAISALGKRIDALPKASNLFLSHMERIGKPITAISHLLEVRPNIQNRKLLWNWLHRAGAFSRDLAFIISFKVGDKEWELRKTNDYNPYFDFLNNIRSDGQYAKQGEVVSWRPGMKQPYGSRLPEEDIATNAAAFGVVGTSIGRLVEPTPPQQREKISRNFVNWAFDAISRKEPKPSYRPLLKLIWLDWFAQAFEPLKTLEGKVENYEYRAISSTNRISPAMVQPLLKSKSVPEHEKNLVRIFILLREALEKYH